MNVFVQDSRSITNSASFNLFHFQIFYFSVSLFFSFSVYPSVYSFPRLCKFISQLISPIKWSQSTFNLLSIYFHSMISQKLSKLISSPSSSTLQLAHGIQTGDRYALSKAITLGESGAGLNMLSCVQLLSSRKPSLEPPPPSPPSPLTHPLHSSHFPSSKYFISYWIDRSTRYPAIHSFHQGFCAYGMTKRCVWRLCESSEHVEQRCWEKFVH